MEEVLSFEWRKVSDCCGGGRPWESADEDVFQGNRLADSGNVRMGGGGDDAAEGGGRAFVDLGEFPFVVLGLHGGIEGPKSGPGVIGVGGRGGALGEGDVELELGPWFFREGGEW